MEDSRKDFSQLGFAKTIVLPALLLFLVPAISLAFFLHAQSRYDDEARVSILEQIRTDNTLTEEERANSIEFFSTTPFSTLMRNPEFAEQVESDVRFDYATFRWMIWLSGASIASGVGVFLLAGLCVLLSLRSLRAQYLSLSAGWHVLRIYSALQTVAQGVLLVALSYWVTALWFNVYVPKLIFLAGLLAIVAVGMVIKAIFKRPDNDFYVAGTVVDNSSTGPVWKDLEAICAKVDTDPPDQIIMGIDANFFVTEQPVIVGKQTLRGRTLYVSLSLLKQLHGAEAAAVVAHEMAHFSGQDTAYSKKISPLLIRYGNYLQALHEGVVTLPIFYFMLCFRSFYELSLGKLSRQREFRADRIAVETTSSSDLAGALLRIIAYAEYRQQVELDLFKEEQTLESANICEQIEDGFHAYAASFAMGEDIGSIKTAHPFDSHPPLSQRLQEIGEELASPSTQRFLATEGDGRWHQNIQDAEHLEKQQWDEYEEQFRKFHEENLAYRYLPATEEETALVTKFFPELRFEGKKGVLTIDFDEISYSEWPESVPFCEILSCTLNDNHVLQIACKGEGKNSEFIKTKSFGSNHQEILDAFNRYYTRHLAAIEYQEQQAGAES